MAAAIKNSKDTLNSLTAYRSCIQFTHHFEFDWHGE